MKDILLYPKFTAKRLKIGLKNLISNATNQLEEGDFMFKTILRGEQFHQGSNHYSSQV